MHEEVGFPVDWENILGDATNEVLMAAGVADGMVVQDVLDPGAWDPCTFAALPDNWKLHEDGRHRRNVKRLQDLSFGLKADLAETRQQEGWPFGNSPCRLFGERNTKKNSRSAVDINRRLFNPDFASKRQEFEEFEAVRSDVTTTLSFEQEKEASIAWGEPSSPTIPPLAGCIRHCHRDSHRAFKRRRSCGDIQDRPQHVHQHHLYLHAIPTAWHVGREHATDRVGRSRGGTPLSKSKSDHPKVCYRIEDEHWRRPNVERAMSIENVVPPEQYHKEQLLHSEEAGDVVKSSATANRTSVYGTTLGHNIRRRRRPARQVSEKGSEEPERIEAAEIESTLVPDDPSRNSDQNNGDPKQDSVSSSDSDGSGFGRDDFTPGTSDMTVYTMQANVETGCSKGIVHGRDLRELWEQGQPATAEDLQNIANRRFLHSVIYRHKLGIQFSALRAEIELDFMQDPIKALQKPERALYVELPIP